MATRSEARQEETRRFKAGMGRFILPPLFGPPIPRCWGLFEEEQPTLDEITVATLRHGHDVTLWWCVRHRHLAPGSVPCPPCQAERAVERERVERLIRAARRRQGSTSHRWPVSTRAAKRRAKRHGRGR